MKILFVNPSLRPHASHRYLPVGLGYVVTAAKAAGFAFDILDIDANGYTDDQVEAFLAKGRYDVVALGSIVTHYRWVRWLVQTAKRVNPGTVTIVGNSVGSSIPEILFANSPVDVVILGEGDITMVEVLEALRDGRSLGAAVEPHVAVPHENGPYPATLKGVGVPGIVFRDAQGRVVQNDRRMAAKVVDDLPWPDWDLFDVETYIRRGRETARGDVWRYRPEEAVVFPVNTARGCVFKCTFCHYVFWHDPYRHRSAESIIGEIRHLQTKYGANYINFWDELSFHKIGPAEKFLDALEAADLNIHYTAAVRSDLFGRDEVSEEDRRRVAEKFARTGCMSLGFSLESGNDEILTAMNKRVRADFFRAQVRILREAGVTCSTSVVVGYPQETPETLADTFRMCEETKVYPSVGYLLPLPATGMWKHALDNGFIPDPHQFLMDITERQDFILNMTTMSDQRFEAEVKNGLVELNKALHVDLDEGSLIRTGGYQRHTQNQDEDIRKSGVHKHRNTTGSMNYASLTGAV